MTQEIKSVLLDILKHSAGLGMIENLKIEGTDEGTTIAAIDPDKTVVLNATLHDVVPEFIGEFGMGNLGLLNSLTRLSNYQDDGAELKVVRRERDGVEVPTSLAFKDASGNKDEYRFMSKEIINQAMQVAKFKGAQWNIEVVPAAKKISQLREVAGIYSSVAPAFTVKIEDGDLIFEVGNTEGGAIGRRVFAENVDGKLNSSWPFPLATFLSILKLSESGQAVVKFSDIGVCQIDIDSGIGTYRYILPALNGS